jgi:hypothetical protein
MALNDGKCTKLASAQSFGKVFCQGSLCGAPPSKTKLLGHKMNHVVTIISNFAVGGDQTDPSAVMSRIFLCLENVFQQSSEVNLPGAVKLAQHQNKNMAEWLGQAHSFMEDLSMNNPTGQVRMRDVKSKVGVFCAVFVLLCLFKISCCFVTTGSIFGFLGL